MTASCPCALQQLRQRNKYPIILHPDGRVTVRPDAFSYPVYTFPSAEAAYRYFHFTGGSLTKEVKAVFPDDPHYIPS